MYGERKKSVRSDIIGHNFTVKRKGRDDKMFSCYGQMAYEETVRQLDAEKPKPKYTAEPIKG